MNINYELIHTVHRISGILNNEETARRLREVAANLYQRSDKRCAALAKVLTKKSGMSQTELNVMREFPEHGINIGNVSLGLIFGGPLHSLSITHHKAIISLIKQGNLAIVEGYRTDIGNGHEKKEQIIVKVKS